VLLSLLLLLVVLLLLLLVLLLLLMVVVVVGVVVAVGGVVVLGVVVVVVVGVVVAVVGMVHSKLTLHHRCGDPAQKNAERREAARATNKRKEQLLRDISLTKLIAPDPIIISNIGAPPHQLKSSGRSINTGMPLTKHASHQSVRERA
jgi:hypothetical protein